MTPVDPACSHWEHGVRVHDALVPLSSVVPGWRQWSHQLPGPSATLAKTGHPAGKAHHSKAQPAQRNAYTWESLSVSVCFSAVYCRDAAGDLQHAIGSICACIS